MPTPDRGLVSLNPAPPTPVPPPDDPDNPPPPTDYDG